MTIDLENLDGNPNIPKPGHVKFFPRNNGLFFMDSTGAVFSMAGGVARVVVADINNPSAELNLISGAADGDMIIAIQITIGDDDVYVIYVWDATPNGGVNPPFSVNGLAGGVWVALSGRFQNQSIESIKEKNFIRFLFNTNADLPSFTTYHGMVAHTHAVADQNHFGTLKFAHSIGWITLKSHLQDTQEPLTPAASVDVNFGRWDGTSGSESRFKTLVLDQNTTLTFSNPIAGEFRLIEITGNFTLTLPGSATAYGSHVPNDKNLLFIRCVDASTPKYDVEFVQEGAFAHSTLAGLLADDHPQYRDGSLPYTGDLDVGNNDVVNVGLVDGVDVSAHAARHQSGGPDELSHSLLADLAADDHTQYTLADGTRSFSGVISGITPTLGSHLTTRDYVDNAVQGIEWQDSVFDRDLASAPGGPAINDRYIVAAGATGVWAAHDDDIATWNGSAWVFTVPTLGMIVGVDDEVRTVRWNGSAWAFFGTTVDHGNLSGLGDDDHPQYHNGSLPYTGTLNMGTNAITNVGLVDGRDVSADGGVLDAHVGSSSNPHSTSIVNLGAGTLAQLNSIVNDATLIDQGRTLTAGAGLTGGGTLEADRTFDVVTHVDGSLVVTADDIRVGVINATQHGNLAGGALHANVIAAGASGFMTGADKTDHNTLTAGPASNADALHGHVPTASSLYSYNFLTAVTATDPGLGNFKFNDATVSAVTAIYFDDLAAGGLSLAAPLFGSLVVGTEITFEQVNNHGKSVIFEITSITDNGGWWTLGVAYRADVGSLFTAAAECSFSLHSGTKVKGYYQNIGYSSFNENYRVRSIASNSSANISFAIPDDFVSVISLSVRGYTDGTVIDQSIDFSSTYSGLGESKTAHTETDTTTTHSYTANIFTDTDLLPVFSSISAGDTCGLLWDNKGIGTTVHVLRVIMAYNAG